MSAESNEYTNNEETVTMFSPDSSSPADTINQHLISHPLVVSLLADPSFVGSRPHLRTPPEHRPHNLTSGVLLGGDRIVIPPLAFVKSDGSRYYSFLYLGSDLCGHPGYVHGGLLATLMDEGLAGCCFPVLPNKAGVTVSLKIDFKKPCKAEQYVVIKAQTTRVEGRKAWVQGRLESLTKDEGEDDPQLLVEAEALFIDPRAG